MEKSRITEQQEVERLYHSFYQLLQPFIPDMKAKCLLTDDIYDYSYVSQGKVSVQSIDDNEELEFTDNAFDVIGFSYEEKVGDLSGFLKNAQNKRLHVGRSVQAILQLI